MMKETKNNTGYSIERCFIGERGADEVVADLVKVHSC